MGGVVPPLLHDACAACDVFLQRMPIIPPGTSLCIHRPQVFPNQSAAPPVPPRSTAAEIFAPGSECICICQGIRKGPTPWESVVSSCLLTWLGNLQANRTMYISRSDDNLVRGVKPGTCMQDPKRKSDHRFGLATGTLPTTLVFISLS